MTTAAARHAALKPESPSTSPAPKGDAGASRLSDLPSGTCGRLFAVDGERSFRRRLMELGLLPGTLVRVVRRAPLGGVVELEVRGCRLSLRLDEAQGLSVVDADDASGGERGPAR